MKYLCCVVVQYEVNESRGCFTVFVGHQGNITTCGFVGAYALILAINAYVYTSLSYITLNILKRFLNSNFSKAFTDVPLQTIGEFTKTLVSEETDFKV